MDRAIRPLLLVAGILLGCVTAAPCRAQSPPVAAPAPVVTIPAPRVWSSASTVPISSAPIAPGSKQGEDPTASAMPSAVSPEIERFVKLRGRKPSDPLSSSATNGSSAVRNGPLSSPTQRTPVTADLGGTSVPTREGNSWVPALPSPVPPGVERLAKDKERNARQSLAAGAGETATGPSSFASPASYGPMSASPLQNSGIRDLPSALPSGSPGLTLSSQPPDRAATPASPLSVGVHLGPTPFAPNDLRFPINLATALWLSDARPLIVAAAQARTWVAEAALMRAKVLWIPMLNIAADYIRHDGGGPDFNKGVLETGSVNYFYGGFGLGGVLPVTDAVYEPLAAREVLNARHWDVQAAKNEALRQTADAYFMVHQYRGLYASALYTVDRARDVTRRVTGLSRDLVSQFEVDRARNMLADLEQRAVSAREQWRVQSAKLTKVLRLDPRAVVEPLEHDHVQITLIDPALDLDTLMPVALHNRPEILSRHASILAAEYGVRREKARPILPMVLLTGYQTPGGMLINAGIFGIGQNANLNQWSGRDDVSIQLIWQVENFGLGNLAKIKGQRGQQSRAIIDLRNAQDAAVAEVTEAHAWLQSAAVRVVQAEQALRTSLIALNGNVEGLEQTSRFADELVLITRPQEAVYALQLLQRAFDQYFATVSEYNRAQFQLFHALGYPASEVALGRPPGEILSVETNRPVYLPPVGNGPPPATR
jgi:outer membrane protein TolC